MIEGLFNFSLKEEEVLDGLFDFDHQFLTHFYLNNPPRFGLMLKVYFQKITGYFTKKVNR